MSSARLSLQPETPFGYATPVIYKIGFPNMGMNGFSKTWGPTTPPDYTRQSANQPRDQWFQELDLNVKSTMIRQELRLSEPRRRLGPGDRRPCRSRQLFPPR